MKLGVLGYVREGGKTLMLYRNKKENDLHEGKWNGLGGKIEMGESPEEAIIREVEEESGLTIVAPRLRGFLTFPKFDEVEDWYVYLFEIEKFSGEIMEDPPEGELHWIEDEKIKLLNLWEGDYLFFEWLKNDKIFSGKLIYESNRLKDFEVFFY